MSEFTKLNGYDVKDKKAREELRNINLIQLPEILSLIKDIKSMVNANINGCKVVESIDDMTDTNIIYVLKGENHYYYHDGTTWVDGGIFGGEASVDGIKYENLDNSLKATITGFSKIDGEVNETGHYLTTYRTFFDGKFVNNTSRVVTIGYKKYTYDLELVEDTSIGLQIGKEFELEKDFIYKCSFATTSGVELTNEEIEDINNNLIFESIGEVSGVEDGSITLEKLSSDLKNLIIGSYTMTLERVNDTTLEVKEVLRGGSIKSNLDFTVMVSGVDEENDITLPDTSVNQNSYIELDPAYSWKIKITLPENAVIDEVTYMTIQSGLVYEATTSGSDSEALEKIGNMNNLATNDRDTLVGAINELSGNFSDLVGSAIPYIKSTSENMVELIGLEKGIYILDGTFYYCSTYPAKTITLDYVLYFCSGPDKQQDYYIYQDIVNLGLSLGMAYNTTNKGTWKTSTSYMNFKKVNLTTPIYDSLDNGISTSALSSQQGKVLSNMIGSTTTNNLSSKLLTTAKTLLGAINETYVKATGVNLWTSDDTSIEFANQTITLDEVLTNYSYIEVIYKRDKDTDYYLSTGKIPVNGVSNGLIQIFYDNKMFARKFAYDKTTANIIFESCSAGDTTNNGIGVPYRILGY